LQQRHRHRLDLPRLGGRQCQRCLPAGRLRAAKTAMLERTEARGLVARQRPSRCDYRAIVQ
jgi:hypothetical protein